MREDDFVTYLAAYVSAATRIAPKLPDPAKYDRASRAWAMLAVAARDGTTGAPPRSPAELTAEIDRICAGVAPV